MVCGWGGSPYVAQKIIAGNAGQTAKLCKAFRDSLNDLQGEKVGPAIETLDAVQGMGISYASKHLRMLDPSNAVVLDKRISDGLGYELTISGYLEFLGHCKAISERLERAGIECSRSAARTWRVSDVEMAIFMHVRATAPKPARKPPPKQQIKKSKRRK
jgi:hypothetical protein